MLEKINLKQAVAGVANLYKYHEIGRLNGNVLTVAKVENRTLDFHVHKDSDELFYVIEGRFVLETEDGAIEMCEGDCVIVPKGISHRPVVTELVKVMLMELEGTLS
ncbi:MAG: cupin domain-containing protein [Clostridiales bacterium]|nr:cupin domain-containing protein [Clostridiales bacterium]